MKDFGQISTHIGQKTVDVQLWLFAAILKD